jgi:tetratricopeptide (TPR) repeat protein
VEENLASQRASELKVIQNSNRLVLVVAGTSLGIGLVAMLLLAWLQWRIVRQLAEFSDASAGVVPFGGGRALPAGRAELQVAEGGAAHQSSARLLSAIERLERRILDLEQTAHVPLNNHTPAPAESGTTAPAPVEPQGAPDVSIFPEEARRITMLLAKGQTLLNLDDTEKAAACFDEVLALDPNQPEALLKKGAALERLRKMDEAIEYYDRAIAADNSMTIAYLCKGGLCNRLDRHSEALECYERALRTQDKRRT